MLYFAYGSNMDWERFLDRCPSSQFLFTASLPKHELAFTRFSRTNRCGTADILPSDTRTVWGVVYHIEAQDRPGLDKHEGVSVGAYRADDVTVLATGDAGRPLRAFTYTVCQKQSPRPKPSRSYLSLLLNGAIRWGLPEAYVEQLRQIETDSAP